MAERIILPDEEKQKKIIEMVFDSEEVYEITFPASALWMIIAHLQLALRHPKATGPTSKAVRFFTEYFIKLISYKIPEAREILEAGWNPDFDIEVEDEENP